jgi:hypothetical protein
LDCSFPTRINLTVSKPEKRQSRHSDSQSMIDIVVNSAGRGNIAELDGAMLCLPEEVARYRVYREEYSPTKSIQTSKKTANRSLRSKLSKMKTGVSATEIRRVNMPQLSESGIVDNFNRLLGADYKVKHFKIARQRLYEISMKKYSHDIITTFFDLQPIENM